MVFVCDLYGRKQTYENREESSNIEKIQYHQRNLETPSSYQNAETRLKIIFRSKFSSTAVKRPDEISTEEIKHVKTEKNLFESGDLFLQCPHHHKSDAMVKVKNFSTKSFFTSVELSVEIWRVGTEPVVTDIHEFECRITSTLIQLVAKFGLSKV